MFAHRLNSRISHSMLIISFFSLKNIARVNLGDLDEISHFIFLTDFRHCYWTFRVLCFKFFLFFFIFRFVASSIFGVRHLQAFLLFLGLTLAYAMRVNLSVAIVAITDKHAANPAFEVRTFVVGYKFPNTVWRLSLCVCAVITWLKIAFYRFDRITNGMRKQKH